MDRLYFSLVFLAVNQPIRYIGVLAAYQAIDKVRPPLYHTLVNQFAEGFVLANIAEVEEELIPEAAVNQVSRSVFCATDIEVYLSPVVVCFVADQCL